MSVDAPPGTTHRDWLANAPWRRAAPNAPRPYPIAPRGPDGRRRCIRCQAPTAPTSLSWCATCIKQISATRAARRAARNVQAATEVLLFFDATEASP